MDRRNFLRTLVGGVAVAAAVRTFPFRVYSFPSTPAVIDPKLARRMLERIREALGAEVNDPPPIWYLNPDQEKALAEYMGSNEFLKRRTIVEHRCGGVAFVGDKHLPTWKNLSRSPQP